MTGMNVLFIEKIHQFIFLKGIARQQKDVTLILVNRACLTRLTAPEIVSVYNVESRGIYNYYCLVANSTN